VWNILRRVILPSAGEKANATYWAHCTKETAMSQATAETITVGALAVRFLVESGDSGGSVSVFECYVPANSRMPAPHSHDAFEETIYGLNGTTTWTVDGEVSEIGVGEALCVPRGATHGFENRGDMDATFLAIASPGVFGPAYFREIGEVLAACAGGPPDLAALARVMQQHGLTPVQPATP
jgi:quercetin dioxygenase-like cupin family protein